MYLPLKKLFKISLLISVLFTCIRCKDNSPVNTPIVTPVPDPDDVSSNRYAVLEMDSASKAIFTYDATSNPQGLKRGYQGCPAIGFNNGIYYAAWFAGVKGEELNNYITIATSSDNGQTWGQNKLLIAPLIDSVRQIDPSFWKDKFGALHLSWLVSKGIWDGAANGTWHVKIKQVSDKIQITKPYPLFHGVMNVKPIHLNKDSTEILFPVSGWNIGVAGLPNYTLTPVDWNGIFLYKSTYNQTGKRILLPHKFAKIPTKFARTFDEPMVLDLGNNSLICMRRSESDGICTISSEDGGVTWGTETQFKTLGPSPSSRFYFGRLKSGNILFIFNNSLNREKLTACLSTDNGKTWQYKLLIDGRNGVSYPDVIQNDKDEICLIYDNSRPYLGEIIFAKFTEADIMNGDASKIKPVIISKLR
ncbi:BNR repeat-like domain-containing protein [Pseudarcicella hirudinis]|uniref:BNR repeat-like domain-containing protein n=1 Tax=Pseudarcicella hirudinis TaxID=1079859 RepID=A0A1I5YPH5_9BACT|nr:sialidase family protein [Pseudarcicella hirudinis]SFQ45837.1 BNR repeat-like domain-containing protein [Pseudarcicella hirudinis]